MHIFIIIIIIIIIIITIRFDKQVFNVQSKNWRVARLVYRTGSETKRNNDKK